MGGDSDPQGIVQEIKVRPYKQRISEKLESFPENEFSGILKCKQITEYLPDDQT